MQAPIQCWTRIHAVVILASVFCCFQMRAQDTSQPLHSSITGVALYDDHGLEHKGTSMGFLSDSMLIVSSTKMSIQLTVSSVQAIQVRYTDSTKRILTSVLKGIWIGGAIGAFVGGVLVGDNSSGDVIGFSALENAVMFGIGGGVTGAIIGVGSGLSEERIYLDCSGLEQADKIRLLKSILQSPIDFARNRRELEQ